MKKILLSIIGLSVLPLFMMAQTNSPIQTKGTTTAAQNGKVLNASSYISARKAELAATKGTRGGSRNYSYTNTIANYNGNLWDLNLTPLWEDSTILTYFGAGNPGFVWLQSAAQVFDPTAVAYNDDDYYPGEVQVGTLDAYTLDSVGVIFSYARNPAKMSIVDTMIIVVTHDANGATTGSDLVYFWETQSFIQTRFGIDSMYISDPYMDFNKLGILSTTATTYKVPLTAAMENDTTAGGWNYIKIATNRSIPPGYQVGASFSFKTGDTWTPMMDTLTSTGATTPNFNRVNFPSLIEDGGSTSRYYSAPDVNFSSLLNHDTTNWNNLYVPSIYYNNPFFDYHMVDFDVTCATCGAVGVNDITYLEGVSIYPNPANNVANIKFLAKESLTNVTAEILTITGQVMRTENIGNVNAKQQIAKQIDINSLSAGIYFVKINANNQKSFTQKLIVE